MNAVQLSADETTLSIAGDITFNSVVDIRRQGELCIEKSTQQHLQCDFQAVNRCESVGLVLMIAWLRFAKRRKKELRWVNVPHVLVRIGEVCGLHFLLEDFHG